MIDDIQLQELHIQEELEINRKLISLWKCPYCQEVYNCWELGTNCVRLCRYKKRKAEREAKEAKGE